MVEGDSLARNGSYEVGLAFVPLVIKLKGYSQCS